MSRMSVRVQVVPYGGWDTNLRVANGEVELILTLEVGPRILRYAFAGDRNVLGEFSEQLGRSRENRWMLRGGHRLWVAPEHKPRTYELDNVPVRHQEIAGGVRVAGGPGLLTGLRKTLEVRLAPKGSRVTVHHTLTNEGKAAAACSAWALTVMAPRGQAIIPLPPLVPHDDRCAPSQNWTLWTYTDLGDPRLKFGTRYLRLAHDPRRGPTKFGIAHREGWVGYLLGRRLFIKCFERLDGRAYPDLGVNFEVYADERILELESMGPLVTLQPGESVEHEERWELFRNVQPCRTEKDIDRHILHRVREPAP